MAHTQKEIERILTNGHTYKRCPKRFKERKKNPNLSKEQLKELNAFAGYYGSLGSSKGGRIKVNSVRNYLQALRNLGRVVQKPYREVSEQDLIEYMKGISQKYKDTTIEGYRLAIVYFYTKWLKMPEKVQDAIFKARRIESPIDKSDLLTKDEIKRMLQHAQSARNRAIIMLTYGEGGFRGGELEGLKFSSVIFDERGCKIYIPKSKTKKRTVRLIDSEPFLRWYLNTEYALSEDRENPLFYASRSGFGSPLNRNAFNEQLKRIAKRAGITKRVFTHLGRHTAINLMHKAGLDVETIANRQGITPETVRRVYLHWDEKDADDTYCRLKGNISTTELEKIEEERNKFSPKICPRCQKKWTAMDKFCTCGMMLDLKVEDEIERESKPIADALQIFLKEKLQEAKERDRLDEIIKSVANSLTA